MSTTLSDLPSELILQVFAYCEPVELAAVSCTSRQLNTLAKDDSLWKRYFQKTHHDKKQLTATYQDKDELAETRDSPLYKKIFFEHPEAICEEYIDLYFPAKALIEICNEKIDVDLKAEELEKKSRQSSRYAMCILSHQRFLEVILKDSMGRAKLADIAESCLETAVYFFQQHTLIDFLVETKLGRVWLVEIAQKYLETAILFFKDQSLIKILLKDFHGHLLIVEMIRTYPDVAQVFLGHTELIEYILESVLFGKECVEEIRKIADEGREAQPEIGKACVTTKTFIKKLHN